MGTALRISAAVGAALIVTVLLLVVFGILGAGLSWKVADYLFPTLAGETKNTNTNYWGSYLLLPLAIAGGLVGGALVFDPKATRRTEAFIIASVFVLVGSVSGLNFWSHDTLINRNAQLLADIVLSVSGLALVGLLIRWKPSLVLTTAIQRVALFLVAVFGFSLPFFYAISLLLDRFGYPERLSDLSTLTKFLTSTLGLIAAVAPSLLAREKGPPVQKS